MDKFLKEKYAHKLIIEKNILEKIKVDEKPFINFLVDINTFKAIFFMYSNRDIKKAKQYFYNSALISLYSIKKYDAPFYTNIYSICYALLSDNEFIINKFSKLVKENDSKILGRLIIVNIQNSLKNNDDLKSQELLVEVLNKKPQGFKGLDSFFQGLRNSNSVLVKKSIDQLISNHGKRGEPELYKDYFSFEISALAKLAWRQGIEVEVNSPLVPKDILPIEPLDNYEIPYDFLKDEIL